MDRTRELLFGAHCLRSGLIQPGQFAETCSFLLDGEDTTFSQALVARGWISPDDATVIDRQLAGPAAQETAPVAGAIVSPPGELTDDWLPDTVPDPALARAVSARLSDPPKARERYRLTKMHAIGGIGQVWKARDGHLGREVALKRLKPDRLTSEMVLARFLEEARITGQLEHPGIVPVYELAEPAEGQQPFYTMRFVRGRTLNEAIHAYHYARAKGEESGLELLALLNGFVAVCNAVAYAHSRGVIHRDIKGQNVVLGDFGEVILLDWGLAKVLNRRGKESDAEPVWLDPALDRGDTLAGSALGTPAYMAPEQAQGLGDQIDERTDVYGLGAILYEILTGRRPFRGDDTNEILRLVCEQEPDRPRSVNPSAPAGLEAACLKAMAKDRAARYPFAAELARDVQRWLADEPIDVYPEPWTTRASRWARRHRTLSASVAAALVMAVAARSISTWLINNARHETVKARDLALQEAKLAREAHLGANADYQTARLAINDLLLRIGDERLANVPQFEPVRRDLLDAAVAHHRTLMKRRPTDVGLREWTARTMRTAANVHRMLDEFDRAAPLYRQAIATVEGLASELPGMPQFRNQLSETLRDLGSLEFLRSGPSAAEPYYQRAGELARGLLSDKPNQADYGRNLGRALLDLGEVHRLQGRWDDARSELDETVARMASVADGRGSVPTDGPVLVMALYDLSEVCRDSGRLSEADKASREAVRRGRENVVKAADNNNAAYTLGAALAERARVLAAGAAGRDGRGDALKMFDEAIERLTRLAGDFPGIVNFRKGLADALESRGSFLAASGDVERAESDWRKAIEILERLSRGAEGNFRYDALLGRTLGLLGRLALTRGETAEARALLERGASALNRSRAKAPDDPIDRAALEVIRADQKRAETPSGEGPSRRP